MNKQSYNIENYGTKSVFCSFLPGISGIKGIPLWCYYVNRGQGVVSFGTEHKDHSIMEFYPAHQAYQTVKKTGFRTFIRKNGVYVEAFAKENIPHQMNIDKNTMSIEETNAEMGLHTQVTYITLPNESVGALVRKVSITNIDSQACELEVLDGMPAIVPYGVDLEALKTMGQTVKAWMEVEDVEKKVPYFKVRATTSDTADVGEVTSGNFSCCFTSTGEMLAPIVDPDVVFSYDKSLERAVNFETLGLDGLHSKYQVTSNQYPSSFYGVKQCLQAKESITLYEVIGYVEKKESLEEFLGASLTAEYFEEKFKVAEELTDELCKVIETKTAHPMFDEYCKYTYMDNVLRGGFPIKLPGDKTFYVYSRKHGDLERDYNFFRMLPEYYSQGNGNFRDVNQNRRMDNFFTPFVEKENMKKFYSMIQLDGYNPLAVEKVTYALSETDAETIFDALGQEKKEEIIPYVTKAFTPGGLCAKLEGVEEMDHLFEVSMEKSIDNLNCDFGEGYWSDHWTYNLDLVESYLDVFPERANDILLEEEYNYFRTQVAILPRSKRYVKVDAGIRQYHFLDEEHEVEEEQKLVYGKCGKGELLKVSLLEKLLVLSVTKYAALDAYGMAVEMEGGKPGWYDALNGLPGLFGASMAETYELYRNISFTKKALLACSGEVSITKEVVQYLKDMDAITTSYESEWKEKEQCIKFWDARNERKELYVAEMFAGICGEKTKIEVSRLLEMLDVMSEVVKIGMEKAKKISGEIVPTYFAYEVESYQETEEGIVVTSFKPIVMPYFLEGPVRYLKMDIPKEEKETLYRLVKESDLYDNKLSMYKVNASLADASFEIGRAKAFTPGWLENESIWLHMEYKYLLEVLKAELYKEFLEDFQKAAVPFLDPEVYGRSILENSSFIASSKNPNPEYHGKGFVARLSGSTVEFLHMWKLMMFGKNNFRMNQGEMELTFEPVLPKALIGSKQTVEAVFVGTTKLTYQFAEEKDYIPGNYSITSMKATYLDGSKYETTNNYLKEAIAKDVRAGLVEEIIVTIE